MTHHKWLNIGLIVTVFYCFLFQPLKIEAKPSKKGKNKSEVSIIKKAWGDINTRNNYYFNAKLIYDELLQEHERNTDINYQDTLPYYFHDRGPSLSAQKGQLQKIIIKTGVVLQRHDYSRWRDDCYTLLGKAYFLRGDIDSALINFQFVSTVLRGDFNDTKVAVSQKEILKAKRAKQKELNKIAKDRNKELKAKAKAKKEAVAKSGEAKKKRMEAAKKAKEKEMRRKIKAKKKMLKRKAKGKAPRTVVKNESKKPPSTKKDKKDKGNFLDKVSEGVTIDFEGKGSQSELNKAEMRLRNLEYQKRKLEVANVEDSLTQKEIENRHKLTLWEKIKHLRSRPEALVWLTKSYIKLGEFQNAESIIEYSKTLVKLRKNQIKDIHIVRSYYYYTIGNHRAAAEALEEAIPFIKKKKERNYYNYLLAQLITNESPQRAYDIYHELYNKGKDEYLSFNALEMMYQFVESGAVINEDMPEILKAYHKKVKSKVVGDKALYTLAEMSLQNADTTEAVKLLEKALTYTFSKPLQKGKTLSKLGDIAYDQFLFQKAYQLYDSAVAFIAEDTSLSKDLNMKVDALKPIVVQQNLAYQQDSLIYLSTLTRSDLAEYVKQKNRVERKQRRRNAIKGASEGTYFSEGLGNNSNFSSSQSQYTSKGKWYFYNIDMRTRGFTEFKQVWGARPRIKNWRRGEVVLQNSMGVADLLRENAEKEVGETLDIQFKIPATEEEFEKSYDILAQSYILRAKGFYSDLDDIEVALIYLDSLINRFPNHELVPEAYYNKMLIYSEIGQMRRAELAANMLIDNFPKHDLTKRILDSRKVKPTAHSVEPNRDAEVYYVSLFGMYREEKYSEVIKGRVDFNNKYSEETTLLPKVDFLEALSLAKVGQIDDYESALKKIIRAYPNSPESDQAKMYLRVLSEYNNQLKKAELAKAKTEKEDGMFKYDEGHHFLIIVFKDRSQNNAELVGEVNELMLEHFPTDRIKASNSFLDANTPLLLIKRFNTVHDAQRAKVELIKSDNLIIKSAMSAGEILLVSQDNFKELFISKKMEEYRLFYEEKYQ